LNKGKFPIIYIAFIIPQSKDNEPDRRIFTVNELLITTLQTIAVVLVAYSFTYMFLLLNWAGIFYSILDGLYMDNQVFSDIKKFTYYSLQVIFSLSKLFFDGEIKSGFSN